LESQLDRIRNAEKAALELIALAAQIREEASGLPIEDHTARSELLETAEGFEEQAVHLSQALKRWRLDIH
jgi:hypothetical protein